MEPEVNADYVLREMAKRNMKQEQFAEFCHVSQKTISRILDGTANLRNTTRKKIIAACEGQQGKEVSDLTEIGNLMGVKEAAKLVKGGTGLLMAVDALMKGDNPMNALKMLVELGKAAEQTLVGTDAFSQPGVKKKAS